MPMGGVAVSGVGWIWDGNSWRTNEERHEDIPQAGDVVLIIGDAAPPAVFARASAPLVLNGSAKRFAAMSREDIRERLRLIGVDLSGGVVRNAAASGWRAARHIRVRVFQDQVLNASWVRDYATTHGRAGERNQASAFGGGYRVRTNARMDSEPLHPQQAAYRKAAATAIRTIYALGLDAGVVELSLEGSKKCCVEAVLLPQEAPEEGSSRGEANWLDAADQLARRMADSAGQRRRVPVLIGADPEFLLVSGKGKIVPADRYLGGGHGAGTDAVVIGGKIARPVAELRPAPDVSPAEVVSRIRRLLLMAQTRIEDASLRWVAGAMPVAGFALGGHIHLSGVPLTNRLLRLLDSYVAIPLAMAEAESGRARRPKFGLLGDCRQQPHGGFEYRTLPSWLVSPIVCEAALSLALLCALETNKLHYCPASEARYADAYYRGDRITLRECLEPLITSMRVVPSYANLANGIEPFIEALRRGEIWDEALDIRGAWSIPSGERADSGILADIASPSVSRGRGVNHRADLL
ncbi:putative amidoligase domain-containing protein [Paenibacillus xanthanilyticus]|uniref:PhiEco32-like amidoligase-type 2 protein n=1 Tax=Paenibacillus xanthanilyticus TaxID=1783531 RepID=A0ABV8K4Y9_9BACL